MPHSTYLSEYAGTAELEPAGPFEAGAYVSLTLTYTAGALGIDDTGGIKISYRTTSDMGKPQFTDPSAPGYTTAEASNGAGLQCVFDRINIRPWTYTIYVRAMKGFLRPYEKIVVRIGDRRFGSPGIRMQTNAENGFPIKVYADPIATYDFAEVPPPPPLVLLPGAATQWVARLPTLRPEGAHFSLAIMPLDSWGNPTANFAGEVELHASQAVEGLPERISLQKGEFGHVVRGLSSSEGDLTITLRSPEGQVLCQSNPLRIEADCIPTYWADLHAQSGETVGAGTARDYFLFARDRAHLDIVGHQANDFQVTKAFWDELKGLYREFNAPGSFVTLPGYEWSGNTGVGGDRNVYFPEEDRTIHRSSHTLVEDGRGDGSQCLHVNDLFAKLRGTGALMVAHVGGRYADVGVGHDGSVETAVEVHSSWGTFEWILHDALALGHRVGVVCGSDDHKGRPGATNPGDSMFGAIGGLTCFPLPTLDRASVFTALRKRRHYGTTGARLHLDVRAVFDHDAELYEQDPALGPATTVPGRTALMGDIVGNTERGTLHVRVLGSAPIKRVTVFDKAHVLAVHRPFDASALGKRIRVVWEGAEYRGRGRMVTWDGTLRVRGNRIVRSEPINFINPNKPLQRRSDTELAWKSVTTGNFAGVDLWIEHAHSGEILFESGVVSGSAEIAQIWLDDLSLEAGGLGKRVRMYRVPEALGAREFNFTTAINKGATEQALYVRVTQTDGHQAWSSPIYSLGNT